MNDEKKPLIEVAREKKQHYLAWAVAHDEDAAAAYVAAYEDGRESVFAEYNAAHIKSLDDAVRLVAEKDARIAELEHEVAYWRTDAEEKSGRIAELEAQLAAHEAKRFHSGKQVLGEYAARQVQGVVVDDELIDVVCDISESLNYAAPEVCAIHVHRMIAALSSAKLVPLASAEVECWRSSTNDGDIVYGWGGKGTPCYRGFPEAPNGND